MKYGDWVTDPRHTSRWRKVRAVMLQAYPLCERCGMRCATEVHHMYSPRLEPDHAFNTDHLFGITNFGTGFFYRGLGLWFYAEFYVVIGIIAGDWRIN